MFSLFLDEHQTLIRTYGPQKVSWHLSNLFLCGIVGSGSIVLNKCIKIGILSRGSCFFFCHPIPLQNLPGQLLWFQHFYKVYTILTCIMFAYMGELCKMPKLHFSYKTLIWINNEHNCNLKQLYINVHFFMNTFYLQWAAYVCFLHTITL